MTPPDLDPVERLRGRLESLEAADSGVEGSWLYTESELRALLTRVKELTEEVEQANADAQGEADYAERMEAQRDAARAEADALREAIRDEVEDQRRKESEQEFEEKFKHYYAANLLESLLTPPDTQGSEEA